MWMIVVVSLSAHSYGFGPAQNHRTYDSLKECLDNLAGVYQQENNDSSPGFMVSVACVTPQKYREEYTKNFIGRE